MHLDASPYFAPDLVDWEPNLAPEPSVLQIRGDVGTRPSGLAIHIVPVIWLGLGALAEETWCWQGAVSSHLPSPSTTKTARVTRGWQRGELGQ